MQRVTLTVKMQSLNSNTGFESLSLLLSVLSGMLTVRGGARKCLDVGSNLPPQNLPPHPASGNVDGGLSARTV